MAADGKPAKPRSLDDSFQLFVKQRSPRATSDESTITISRSGYIRISDKVMRAFEGTTPTAFLLFYNPTTRTLALQPAPDSDPRTYLSRPADAKSQTSKSVTVRAKIFFQSFDIPLDKTYPVSAEVVDGVIFADLPST